MTGAARSLSHDMRLSATPEALWPYLSDTGRLNAALGHPPRRFVDLSPDGLARHSLLLEGGTKRKAVEKPGEWVHGQWWRLSQQLDTGPLASSRVTLFLQRDGHNTRARYTVEATPRGKMGQLLLTDAYLRSAIQAFEAEARGIVAYIAGGRARPFGLDEAAPLPEARRLELAARLAESSYGGIKGPELIDFLLCGHDVEVGAFRASTIARRFRISLADAAGVCLAAVRAGLAQHRLSIVCPICRATTAAGPDLHVLPDVVDCDQCGFAAPLALDTHLESVFTVSPSLRAAPRGAYCLSGPHRHPHILIQQILDAAERRAFPLSLPEGRYRARVGAGTFSEAVMLRTEGAIVQAGPGGITISGAPENREVVFENHTEGTVVMSLEYVGWPEGRMTGGTLLMLQSFRDLFPGAAIPGGEATDAGPATMVRLRTTDPNAELIPDPLKALAVALDGALVVCDGAAADMVFREASGALRAAIKLTEAKDIAVGVDSGAVFARPGPGMAFGGHVADRAARLCTLATGGEALISRASLAEGEATRIAERAGATLIRTSIGDGTGPEDVLRITTQTAS